MNPVDIDPTLRAGEPLRESLDDGFSPPSSQDTPPPRAPAAPAQPVLGAKSPF